MVVLWSVAVAIMISMRLMLLTQSVVVVEEHKKQLHSTGGDQFCGQLYTGSI
jgi:hypothetical protein